MNKVAMVFLLAVFLPSLVLAWLAIQSLRDQQVVIEQQQSLLYQSAADALAEAVHEYVAERQSEFGARVESLLAGPKPRELAAEFDAHLLKAWTAAEVGFAVTLEGQMLSPSLLSRKEARQFLLDNHQFLCSKEAVQVYYASPKGPVHLSQIEESKENTRKSSKGKDRPAIDAASLPKDKSAVAHAPAAPVSKIAEEEAEFRQLIGNAHEGSVARFLQNKLKLLVWYRSPQDPQLVFGAQLRLPWLMEGLRPFIQRSAIQFEPFRISICLALLDETGKPVAVSHPQFVAAGQRPFVASEIGERLPHWKLAVFLLHPEQLNATAKALKFYVTLLIGILLLAIGLGGWSIVMGLRRELTLARQKTDFVSNVSHELKTPLTSIRMFSELLAQGRITDAAKQKSYLNIIASEAARLTRLINNVLDFARLERGEKKYHFESVDLARLARETLESCWPHLEAEGFQFSCDLPEAPQWTKGDRDALAQVLVNLLSNAEKYSGDRKEIEVRLRPTGLSERAGLAFDMATGETPAATSGRLRWVEIHVLDRGLGVPKGCEARIFDQFYRAHDSLNSGIQGSGLGLTLARRIARAHGGDVAYAPRDGGGSVFALRMPLTDVGPLERNPKPNNLP